MPFISLFSDRFKPLSGGIDSGLIPTPTPTPTNTPTLSATMTPTLTPTASPTHTPTNTPTLTTSGNGGIPGQHVFIAQAGIPWNGYGANYLSFGYSQEGVNFAPQAGWYFIDSNGNVRRLLNNPLWFSGGNPSPYRNGNGWMAVSNASFYISPSETTITFYETSPV